MTKKHCSACGAERLETIRELDTVRADDGTELSFEDGFTRCAACENEFYTYDQSVENSRQRTNALRTHEGLLTPDEIRGIRTQFGFSQVQLEDLLRSGRKCVTRWERGLVRQSRAIDELLRLYRDNPEIVNRTYDSLNVPAEVNREAMEFDTLPDFHAGSLRTRVTAEWTVVAAPSRETTQLVANDAEVAQLNGDLCLAA